MTDSPRPSQPRIAPLPPDERDDTTRDLLGRLAIGGGELNIFATLVRHPALFRRWMAFGGELLMSGTIPARERELLILRTGSNCRTDYEWGQHVIIAKQAGVTDEEIERVQAIVTKRGLGTDPEVQVHEDALCLVFLETQLDDLVARFDEDKVVDILRKTARKMSPAGLAAAASLPLSPTGAALVERALAEEGGHDDMPHPPAM